MVNLKFLFSLIDDKEKLVNSLVEWKLIPPTDSYLCSNCGNSLELRAHSDAPDGLRWVCPAKIQKYSHSAHQRCGNRVEFRYGTFFARAKLSMTQVYYDKVILLS